MLLTSKGKFSSLCRFIPCCSFAKKNNRKAHPKYDTRSLRVPCSLSHFNRMMFINPCFKEIATFVVLILHDRYWTITVRSKSRRWSAGGVNGKFQILLWIRQRNNSLRRTAHVFFSDISLPHRSMEVCALTSNCWTTLGLSHVLMHSASLVESFRTAFSKPSRNPQEALYFVRSVIPILSLSSLFFSLLSLVLCLLSVPLSLLPNSLLGLLSRLLPSFPADIRRSNFHGSTMMDQRRSGGHEIPRNLTASGIPYVSHVSSILSIGGEKLKMEHFCLSTCSLSLMPAVNNHNNSC